jgi:hypothetical protein
MPLQRFGERAVKPEKISLGRNPVARMSEATSGMTARP